MLRRNFLKALAASLVVYQQPLLATNLHTKNPPKVVWVMLRGALDSLHTVIPTFEPALKILRPTLYKSIEHKWQLLTQAPSLQQGYALHPALVNLHHWYQNKQLLPIVAVSSGYKKRSHFEAQDYLESALTIPDSDSGWLARAIQVKNKQAMAISQSMPISLRGENQLSNTWYPSRLPDAQPETYQALQHLYQYSEQLSGRLEEGLAMEALLDKQNMAKKQQGNFINLSHSCGKLLAQPNMDCAMLTLGGWDTHKNQSGQLQRQLSLLDKGLQALKMQLGPQWDNTLVIVATEFGRTVKENGTRGTDHGTASALFLAGGKVNGGKILGDWPGLQPTQLHQQRDLKATSNSFDWIAGSLQQHWQLSDQQVRHIFPTANVYHDKMFRI
jgi:uncharacterized protein (DUF1501 family)